MRMKLGEIELIKRVDKNGAVQEIRSIHNLSVTGKRRIVELPIPGSTGNVFQDMGRNPLRISFDGILVGPGAMNALQDVKLKFEMREPIPFSTDLATINNVTEVVIDDFAVQFIRGVTSGARYSMVLKEHKSSETGLKGGPEETEPPSQEASASAEVELKTKEIHEDLKRSFR